MRKLKLTQAFTLIELLVVIAIIFVIAGMIMGVGKSAREAAKKNKAAAMIASLGVAISMYHADTGAYPPDNGGTGCGNLYLNLLSADPEGDGDTPGWDGAYMEFKDDDLNQAQTHIIDAWGNEYHYDESPAFGNTTSYSLWSEGPNGDDNSSDGDTDYGDDITNW